MKAVTKVRTLEECEANISRWAMSFWEMGTAYAEIRDGVDPTTGKVGLWRKTHDSWATYCRERWGYETSTVSGVIAATEVRTRLIEAQGVRPGEGTEPSTEKQIRPLSTLPDDEQADAWREAVEVAEAEGKAAPTYVIVDEVVKKRKAAKGPKRPPPTSLDRAFEAAKKMRDSADDFVSKVRLLMPHMDLLADHEAQGCAYKIAETVHGVLDILQQAGYMTPDVSRGLLSNPEDGMTEVVS